MVKKNMRSVSSRAVVFDVRSCPANQTAKIMVEYAFGFVTSSVV
jgi:hypothetical protein